jgi:hypothetical protein
MLQCASSLWRHHLTLRSPPLIQRPWLLFTHVPPSPLTTAWPHRLAHQPIPWPSLTASLTPLPLSGSSTRYVGYLIMTNPAFRGPLQPIGDSNASHDGNIGYCHGYHLAPVTVPSTLWHACPRCANNRVNPSQHGHTITRGTRWRRMRVSAVAQQPPP